MTGDRVLRKILENLSSVKLDRLSGDDTCLTDPAWLSALENASVPHPAEDSAAERPPPPPSARIDEDVHVESILCALGALAGYACQASVREQAVAQGLSETGLFAIMTAQTGQRYFFCNQLNQALVESPSSVWCAVSDAAQRAGSTYQLDMNDLFKHVLATMDSSSYGLPRLPEVHQPMETPLNYLKKFWPVAQTFVKQLCPSAELWPIVFSNAIQETIYMSRQTLDPGLALIIVMESAVPMSRVDLPNA